MGATRRLTRVVMGTTVPAPSYAAAYDDGRDGERSGPNDQGRSLNRSTASRSPETMMTSPGTTTVSGVA